METGILVELTKLRAAPAAAVQPGSWDSYPLGSAEATSSLPVDYVLVGVLIDPPRVGRAVRILRLSRNGVEALGIYESTMVLQVTQEGFVTRNSVYRLRRVISEN